MGVELTLRPGQPGTKKLVAEYGDRLVAVRYRTVAGLRLKTVELVVDRWRTRRRPRPDDILLVRIGFGEGKLQRKVMAVGGLWNRAHQAWELRRDMVTALGLGERVIGSLDEIEALPYRG